jgi:hypothetical protein
MQPIMAGGSEAQCFAIVDVRLKVIKCGGLEGAYNVNMHIDGIFLGMELNVGKASPVRPLFLLNKIAACQGL